MSFGARSDKGEMIPSLEMRFTCQPLEQTKALDGGMAARERERDLRLRTDRNEATKMRSSLFNRQTSVRSDSAKSAFFFRSSSSNSSHSSPPPPHHLRFELEPWTSEETMPLIAEFLLAPSVPPSGRTSDRATSSNTPSNRLLTSYTVTLWIEDRIGNKGSQRRLPRF